MKKIVRIRRKIPAFHRPDYHKWFGKRAKKTKTWFKPKGSSHGRRKKLLSYHKGASPKIGYRTPKAIRELHPSGLEPILVRNVKDLENINIKAQGIILAKVGRKNKIAIIEKALSKNIKILNLRKPKEKLEELKGAKK